MKTENIFGNWIITVVENSDLIKSGKFAWVGVNYQQEAPMNQDDIAPDWGFGCDGDTIEDAAIQCIEKVWRSPDGTLDKAVELAAALIALGIIGVNCEIDDTAAIIDGRWFFGRANEEKHGIAPWNTFFEYRNINEFEFSKQGRKLAEKILRAAIKEDEEFQRGYAEWEASWIDGPQV